MALIDRFAPNAGTGPGQNGFFALPTHEFSATVRLVGAPLPVTANKGSLITLWNLTTNPTPDADELQLDELINNYNALATLDLKNQYASTIEDTLFLYQTNRLDLPTTKTWLAIT